MGILRENGDKAGNRKIWTLQPAADVVALVNREIKRQIKETEKASPLANPTISAHGLRTQIILDALRAHLAHHMRKRELTRKGG